MGVPEIQHHAPGVPILLVGTKSDLRNDDATLSTLNARGASVVQASAAEGMAKEIGAVKYLECSALTQEGLKNVFDDAIRAAITKPKKEEQGLLHPVRDFGCFCFFFTCSMTKWVFLLCDW